MRWRGALLKHAVPFKPGVLSVLRTRGLVQEINNAEMLETQLDTRSVSVYCGFDPTSDALHLGNYLALVSLKWMQMHGHNVICVIGGATARIGDPSGKTEERRVISEEQVQKNAKGIEKCVRSILGKKVTVLNNADWMKKMSAIEFLVNIGRHMRMGTMMNKDSVKLRMQAPSGLSFTEFSYQALQAYDFAYLNYKHNVTLQIGGSDQLGNMQAGLDLSRKMKLTNDAELCALTFPLLLGKNGKKFGKSEAGAIWLDPSKTSPYGLYQYLLRNTKDELGKQLLYQLTFLNPREIELLLMQQLQGDETAVQKALARAVTKDIYGKKGLETAIRATSVLHPPQYGVPEKPTAADLKLVFNDVPNVTVPVDQVIGLRLYSLLKRLKLVPAGSIGAVMESGHVAINNRPVLRQVQNMKRIELSDILGGEYLMISVGRKARGIVRMVAK